MPPYQHYENVAYRICRRLEPPTILCCICSTTMLCKLIIKNKSPFFDITLPFYIKRITQTCVCGTKSTYKHISWHAVPQHKGNQRYFSSKWGTPTLWLNICRSPKGDSASQRISSQDRFTGHYALQTTCC